MMHTVITNTIPLLGEYSGVGRCIYEIALRMHRRADFHHTYYYGYFSDILLLRDNERLRGSEGMLRFLGGMKKMLGRHHGLKSMAKKMLALASRLTVKEFDVYFEPNFIVQPGIKARRRVVTIHDFSCIRFPEWHPPERVQLFERQLWSSLQQADHIVTVSEAIRREAISDYGIAPEKISAIHNGVDLSRYRPPSAEALARFRAAHGLENGYILFVGPLEPRKNLVNLLYAYDALPGPLKHAHSLVIAGGKGWMNKDIHDCLLKMREHVRVLGYVPEDTLPLLYGAASALVYPSWYEGFGLPVLEGMACGCPVVTSNDPALIEVGGDAALHVPPGDVDGLRDTLQLILEDATLRQKLVEAGLTRVPLFSWDMAANSYARLFISLCAG